MGIAVALTGAEQNSVRPVVDWARLVVSIASRAVLGLFGALLLWAAAPSIIGWHSTTVMSGSMEPLLDPGDVVVSRPVDAADLRRGEIVLVHDPVQPGRLLMHRFVERRPGHLIVLRGDANAQPDSTPVSEKAVIGVATVRVVWVGRPLLWLARGEWGSLLAVGVLLVLAIVGLRADSSLSGGDRRPGAHRRNRTRSAPVRLPRGTRAAFVGAHHAARR